jgi:hypothetical protein
MFWYFIWLKCPSKHGIVACTLLEEEEEIFCDYPPVTVNRSVKTFSYNFQNAIREEGFLIDEGPCVWYQESYVIASGRDGRYQDLRWNINQLVHNTVHHTRFRLGPAFL